MKRQSSDPPFEPLDGTAIWYESGPDPIENHPDDAVLIVRIGMACNVLTAQLHAGADAGDHPMPGKSRDQIASLATWCGYTNEAITLARENMARLRTLARPGGIAEHKLALVGQITGGKHPASAMLHRARNRLVFHWDDEIIRRSTLEYVRNERVIWMEANSDLTEVVHRLSFEVLSHALFFEASTTHEGEAFDHAVGKAIDEVRDAMRLIVELFTAATFGYMKSFGATRREKESK